MKMAPQIHAARDGRVAGNNLIFSADAAARVKMKNQTSHAVDKE
jgi:hypothetical protein